MPLPSLTNLASAVLAHRQDDEHGHRDAPYTQGQFDSLRADLNHGRGSARGLIAHTRAAAMDGMRMLAIRDPHRLGYLITDASKDADSFLRVVGTLASYARTHKNT